MSFKLLILLLIIAGALIFGAYVGFDIGFEKAVKLPEINQNQPKPTTTNSPKVEVIASSLEVPWALAFLPDNSILVTERKGTVRLVKDGKLQENPVATVNVKPTGESGLHGIAIDPNFNSNNYVYLYYTYSGNGNQTLNRVSQYKYTNQNLTEEKVLVDGIPGAIFHDGGRIKFGPDGNLYITTGDALEPSRSQDKNSLAGKILRIVNEKIEVYSYGHRNPQGIAWDDKGNLWETEHGESAKDEVNQITQGKNYGWPTIRGDEKQAGMENPKIHSGNNTWAPGGLAFFDGKFYFAGLRGRALFQYNPNTNKLTEYFKEEFGRIRDIIVGPDNMLYITTSNKDGRGNPSSDDDKIIKINPASL